MISSLVAGIASAIGSQVVGYLKEHTEQQQLERMQGEILEGWIFKIKIAIRDTHRANDVPLNVHKKVMEALDDVVRKEFDTTKL